MANWKYKIELGRVMDEMCDKHDLSRFEEELPQEVKDAISAELAKAPPLARFAKRIKGAKSIAEGNRILNDMFDVADEKRVWTGGVY